MVSSLLLSRFNPSQTCTASTLRLRYSLCAHPPPRHRPIRLSASRRGSEASDDREDGEFTEIESDLSTLPEKVIDAYRNSNNDLRTFLQNLVDAGVADESTVFGGEEDEFLRALIDADLPGRSPDLSVLWKLPAVAVASFAGVPALLGYLGEAAGAHVPAWMPLVYSLASFLAGTLLIVDSSISDEEWEEWVGRREREGELAFLESEEVLWRTARRVPAAVLAASAAGEAALRAAAAVTGLDLQPPIWVAFLLFGLLLGVPYGVFSASFDPAVEGSWLGWEEFVNNIRDIVLRAGEGHDRGPK
ncbi:hypothetical protein GUJ93_ZPchr0006g43043 [Zizania palustris]|uniref:Uncharacterized protein n=1 Tax=Zizania palustris TaxID=103762 RepID=A0A8J5T8T9_ZIZPA|nr:hypothetical protein GUJ93_ZPchr0006g43043 [Zizania palustris]